MSRDIATVGAGITWEPATSNAPKTPRAAIIGHPNARPPTEAVSDHPLDIARALAVQGRADESEEILVLQRSALPTEDFRGVGRTL